MAISIARDNLLDHADDFSSCIGNRQVNNLSRVIEPLQMLAQMKRAAIICAQGLKRAIAPQHCNIVQSNPRLIRMHPLSIHIPPGMSIYRHYLSSFIIVVSVSIARNRPTWQGMYFQTRAIYFWQKAGVQRAAALCRGLTSIHIFGISPSAGLSRAAALDLGFGAAPQLPFFPVLRRRRRRATSEKRSRPGRSLAEVARSLYLCKLVRPGYGVSPHFLSLQGGRVGKNGEG